MLDYHSTLLREKTTIDASGTQLITMSNRLYCPMHDTSGNREEYYIIRSRNMYDCIRMAAKLTQAHETGGSLVNREKALKWDRIWESVESQYDQEYKEDSWICVYHNGQTVFEHGEHHPFLDIIEHVAGSAKHAKSTYEQVLSSAKDAFQQSGKDIKITQESNVAFLMNADDTSIRCGTTHRTALNTFTMSFSTTANDKKIKLHKKIELRRKMHKKSFSIEKPQYCLI